MDAISETPPSVSQENYEALLARIAELERQLPQRPARTTTKFTAGKPFKFEGERNDQRVMLWLSEVDTQIKIQSRITGDVMEEVDKLLIAESFLEDRARRHYNAKVKQDGEFTTYEDFKTWMRKFYAPSDLIAKYRHAYRNCRQRADEGLEEYYLRFTEIVHRMDKTPEESLQVSDFVSGLQSIYAEKLGQFVDISDYENVTLTEVMERLTRTLRLATMHTSGSKIKSRTESSNQSGKSHEHQVSSKSKRRFKKSDKPTKSLTPEQKRRVERLMEKDGGEFVGKVIRDNPEWIKMSDEKHRCYNCAGRGHVARKCPIQKQAGDQLNAMIPDYEDVGSSMQEDIDYLCALAECSTSLALFPCAIDRCMGIAFLDYGATRNYISRAYAKRARLEIRQDAVNRSVRMLNGQTMRVYGTAEIVLDIAEWVGRCKLLY